MKHKVRDRNECTNLLHGSDFLYHLFNVLVVLILCVAITLILILPLTAAWQVRLNEDGLSSSDVAAAVWAGVAS